MRLDFPRVHLYFSRENRLFLIPLREGMPVRDRGHPQGMQSAIELARGAPELCRGLGWNQGDPLHHQAKFLTSSIRSYSIEKRCL